jgi:DNA-binding MarR family transcriptional regulator
MTAADDLASRHSANVLGALALVLHDRFTVAIADAIGQTETGAATLSMLDNFLDEPRVGRLHQVLGLTPSGAVRLVDRLEAEGYLERGPGSDRRSTSLRLTPEGRKTAGRVAAARSDVLEHALSTLSPEQRQTLDALVSRILVGLIRGPGATRWMCRLCDADACGHDRGTCPVANAARESLGSR